MAVVNFVNVVIEKHEMRIPQPCWEEVKSKEINIATSGGLSGHFAITKRYIRPLFTKDGTFLIQCNDINGRYTRCRRIRNSKRKYAKCKEERPKGMI